MFLFRPQLSRIITSLNGTPTIIMAAKFNLHGDLMLTCHAVHLPKLFFIPSFNFVSTLIQKKKKEKENYTKNEKKQWTSITFPLRETVGKQPIARSTETPLIYILYPNFFSWPANISARVLNEGSPNRRSPSCTHLLIWVNIPTLQRIPVSICVISHAFISQVSVLGPT